ncbi:hypothetical protein C4J81_07780 [Deltaproteobacteria bacterium Smac51]|nr:hypothetical protein C4J81_07780 [Deltaproteobacteria bacterium Smac51]
MSNPSPAAALINEAAEAAQGCFGLDNIRITALTGGRVNESFMVEHGHERFVLQKLNDIFMGSPSLGLNWKSLRDALAARAEGWLQKPVPDIFPGLDGQFTPSSPTRGGYWRLTSYIAGLPASIDPPGAREAARLTGALHRLLNNPAPIELLPPPEGELTNQRLTRPEDFEILAIHYQRHPHLDALRHLIAQGTDSAWQLPSFPAFLCAFQLNEVVIHGDPKADNFIFTPDGHALALIDWDNLRYGHVLTDVAEMLRSWGKAPEPCPASAIHLENMAAVVEGYAETGLPLSTQDLTLLPAVLRGITITLARRYLTDALAEVFFKWDREKYPSLYIQNRTRAEAMLDLSEYLLEHEMRLVDTFHAAYERGKSCRVEPSAIHIA